MNRSSTVHCRDIAKNLSASLDGLLTADEESVVNAHVGECPRCANDDRSIRDVRSLLGELPRPKMPIDLGIRLRVVASHEKVRRARLSSFQSRLDAWRLDFGLFVKNLMRPLAIPAFGGFASAVVLFSVLSASPAFTMHTVSGRDVPTGLYTEASVMTVKSVMPVSFVDDDIIVDVTVDGEGRMVDYMIQDCEHLAKTPALRKAIERNLLFTEFIPATYWGRTVRAKVRLSFLNSRIDVKG
jgi:hypothetical protein